MNRAATTRDRVRAPRTTADRRRAGSGVAALPNRRRTRRTSRRRRTVQAVLTVALLSLAVWLVWAGPVLAVSTVQVDGVTTLPAELVREAAGVEEGTPLLRVDVDAAEAGVAALPQVASVEVTRGWPRTVVITVVERVPVAVVGEPGNRSLVDAEGVLFDSVSGQPPAGVVQLVVDSPGPGDPATMAALTAIRALPAALRDQVAGVAAPDPDDISMALVDGTVVRWGDAAKSPAKASALAALLGQIAAGTLEPAATIDVSAPESVVLR
jgi:cell division protein FtsQ